MPTVSSHARAPFVAAELRAYHEAGHAVVALLRGFAVTRITIVRRGRVGGSTAFQFRLPRRGPPGTVRSLARAGAAVALGGSVAQDVVLLRRGFLAFDLRTGAPFPLFAPGAQDDEVVALRFAGRLYRSAAARRAFLRRMRASTERLLLRPRSWAAVRALAGALRRERTLTGDEVAARILHALARRQAHRR